MSAKPLHVAIDVAYRDDTAFAAAAAFQYWSDETATLSNVLAVSGVSDYVPGKFYLRELPAIIGVVQSLNCNIGTLIIDGYVTLGRDNRPGLGFHVWEHFDRALVVIGVAKSRYPGTPDEAALTRGRSTRPLYVTSAGIDQSEAKSRIAAMHGRYRLPTVLKYVDTLARMGSATSV